jgi:hypothetical protein
VDVALFDVASTRVIDDDPRAEDQLPDSGGVWPLTMWTVR